MDVSYSANLSAGAVVALLLVSVAVYAYYAFSMMTISHKTGTGSGWLGILMLVPVVNFIIPGYLAFAEPAGVPSGRPIHH